MLISNVNILSKMNEPSYAVCVTTNGVVKKNGELVMGAGVAKTISDAIPGIAKFFGDHVKSNGNIPCSTLDSFDFSYKGGDSCAVISFPTKHHYNEKADLDLIINSAMELVELTDNPYVYFDTVYIPSPGTGLGGLDKTTVYNALAEILVDDKYVICDLDHKGKSKRYEATKNNLEVTTMNDNTFNVMVVQDEFIEFNFRFDNFDQLPFADSMYYEHLEARINSKQCNIIEVPHIKNTITPCTLFRLSDSYEKNDVNVDSLEEAVKMCDVVGMYTTYGFDSELTKIVKELCCKYNVCFVTSESDLLYGDITDDTYCKFAKENNIDLCDDECDYCYNEIGKKGVVTFASVHDMNKIQNDTTKICIARKYIEGSDEHMIELAPSYGLFSWYLQNKDNKGWFKTYKETFISDAKQSYSFNNKYNEIKDRLNSGENIALLCFCKDINLCHRSIIKEKLVKDGYVIEDINNNNYKVIDSFRDRYYFLSNMYPTNIKYKGLNFACSESLFQSYKCANNGDRFVFEFISGYKAKSRGREVKFVENWDKIKLDAMESTLRLKFSDKNLANKLMATKEAELIEGNTWHDNFWGVCKCGKCSNGKNNLGKLLMKIRDELLNGNDTNNSGFDQDSPQNTTMEVIAMTNKTTTELFESKLTDMEVIDQTIFNTIKRWEEDNKNNNSKESEGNRKFIAELKASRAKHGRALEDIETNLKLYANAFRIFAEKDGTEVTRLKDEYYRIDTKVICNTIESNMWRTLLPGSGSLHKFEHVIPMEDRGNAQNMRDINKLIEGKITKIDENRKKIGNVLIDFDASDKVEKDHKRGKLNQYTSVKFNNSKLHSLNGTKDLELSIKDGELISLSNNNATLKLAAFGMLSDIFVMELKHDKKDGDAQEKVRKFIKNGAYINGVLYDIFAQTASQSRSGNVYLCPADKVTLYRTVICNGVSFYEIEGALVKREARVTLSCSNGYDMGLYDTNGNLLYYYDYKIKYIGDPMVSINKDIFEIIEETDEVTGDRYIPEYIEGDKKKGTKKKSNVVLHEKSELKRLKNTKQITKKEYREGMKKFQKEGADGFGLIDIRSAAQWAECLGCINQKEYEYFVTNFISFNVSDIEADNRLSYILNKIPTAYQVRHHFDKGLLVVWDLVSEDIKTDEGEDANIVMPKSMHKLDDAPTDDAVWRVCGYNKKKSVHTYGTLQAMQALQLPFELLKELADSTVEFLTRALQSADGALEFLSIHEFDDNGDVEKNDISSELIEMITANPDCFISEYVQKKLLSLIEKAVHYMIRGKVVLPGTYYYMITDPRILVHLATGKKQDMMKMGEYYLNGLETDVVLVRYPCVSFLEPQKVHLSNNDALWFMRDLMIFNCYDGTWIGMGGAD